MKLLHLSCHRYSQKLFQHNLLLLSPLGLARSYHSGLVPCLPVTSREKKYNSERFYTGFLLTVGLRVL